MAAKSRGSEIAAELRRRIEAGVYPDGRLPLYNDLLTEFGIARNTLDRVLAELDSAGLITRRRGSGMYVRRTDRVVRYLLDDVLKEHRLALAGRTDGGGLFEQMTGQDDVVVTVEYDRQPATDEVAATLRVDPGVEVLQRTFRYTLEGIPHQVAYGWMPATLADLAGLTSPDVERPGVGTMVQLMAAGVDLGKAYRRVESRMPTLAEVVDLALPAGTPVFEVQRVLYRREPVEVVEAGVAIVAADRVAYVLEIDLEDRP